MSSQHIWRSQRRVGLTILRYNIIIIVNITGQFSWKRCVYKLVEKALGLHTIVRPLLK